MDDSLKPGETLTFGVGAKVPAIHKWSTNEASQELDAIFIANPYVRRKLNRERRSREKAQYIMEYVPEATNTKGTVVDVGCADGMFLEFARAAGNAIIGIDTLNGLGGMGDDYCKAAKLLADRQHILVYRVGWNEFIGALAAEVPEQSCSVFNFQGSWAMVLFELGYIIGPPHHEHHDTKKLTYDLSPGIYRQWRAWFTWMHGRLIDNGVVMMLFNETMNQKEMVAELDTVVEACGFEIIRADDCLMRKYRKLAKKSEIESDTINEDDSRTRGDDTELSSDEMADDD